MNKVNEIIDLIKSKIDDSKNYNYNEINKLSEEVYSHISIKYPEIYEKLVEIGKFNSLRDFVFTSIHVNHNVICPPHKDENNKGGKKRKSVS